MRFDGRDRCLLFALCVAGSAAAGEPSWPGALPRERVTLAGLEAAPLSRAELTLAGAHAADGAPAFLSLPVRGATGAQALLAGGSEQAGAGSSAASSSIGATAASTPTAPRSACRSAPAGSMPRSNAGTGGRRLSAA